MLFAKFIGSAHCPKCKEIRPIVEERCNRAGINFAYSDISDITSGEKEMLLAAGVKNLPVLVEGSSYPADVRIHECDEILENFKK